MSTISVVELPRPRLHVAVLGLLVSLACYGAWLVVASPPRPSADPVPSSLQVGEARFVVSHVEWVTGLTEDDLSGMGHGIQGLVRDDSTMLRVWLTVSAGDATTAFDASRLRLFSSAGGDALAPVGGSIGGGRLSAHASVEGAVSFVVPRDQAQLALGAVGTDVRIALGHVDQAPAGAGQMDEQMDGHMDMHMPAAGTTPGHHHQHETTR